MTIPAFDLSTPRGALAGEVRGAMGKRKLKISELARRTDKSREYWRRRITLADTALDIDDLDQLARLLGMSVPEFFGAPAADAPTGPGDDPGSPVTRV